MSQVTFSQVVTTSIAAEKTFEQLYRRLAEMFAEYPEVVEYWLKYAREEAGHARWMEKVNETATPEELNTPIDMATSEMVRTVANFSVEKALAGIKNLEDAYQLAVDLENSETNAIFSFVIQNVSLEASTADFLRKQLQEHISQIASRLPEQYNSQVTRQAALVNDAIS